jgi:hypothetical protein
MGLIICQINCLVLLQPLSKYYLAVMPGSYLEFIELCVHTTVYGCKKCDKGTAVIS